MMRHVASEAATRSGWPDDAVNAIILGHNQPNPDPNASKESPVRLAYLPLPSLEFRGHDRPHIGSIRRVLVVSFREDGREHVLWARRALATQDLIDRISKKPIAMLSSLPASDSMVHHYTKSASEWATVTPVVLPGHDDPGHFRRRLREGVEADEQKRLLGHIHKRVESLIRKAIIQAGVPEYLAKYAEIEWRQSGFWPGNMLANEYSVPKHLRASSRYHVYIGWRDEQNNPIKIPGPLCVGGGRYYGLGLFAALPQSLSTD